MAEGPKIAMQMSLSFTLWAAAMFCQTLFFGLGKPQAAAASFLFSMVAAGSMFMVPFWWEVKHEFVG